jgi:hypothetical protein
MARLKHKPESGVSRRNYFLMEVSEADRMFPFRDKRFSSFGIRKSLPNNNRPHADGFPNEKIPRALRNNIPF